MTRKLTLRPADWSEPLHPDQAADLIADGLPPEAIRDDLTLDVEAAARAGWIVVGPGVLAPPDGRYPPQDAPPWA